MTQVFGLFPTPVAHVPGVLAGGQAASLAGRLAATATVGNQRSGALTHSRLLGPGEDATIDEVVALLGPHVQAFGQLLFGQPLPWLVKEIWANVLRAGASQAVHNHANCFVSGVLYLTPCDASARTVFLKGLGGSEFAFRNTSAATTPGEFDADKWVAPDPQPGDLLLFPSYLLHEVPPNQGGERVTLAFNAIPQRLDAGATVCRSGPRPAVSNGPAAPRCSP
jgi:uncharacterized protein (TIGR02466 family)